MSVTVFFSVVVSILTAIFVFFRPMELDEPVFTEIAQLELDGFTLYELNENGLKTTLSGMKGARYEDRYEAAGISFTDSSKEYTQNMVADYGIYQDSVVYLSGGVRYTREDGLEFISDEATYEQKTATVSTEGPFTVLENENKVTGKTLVYQTKEGKIAAKNIDGNYFINEEKE